MAANYIQSIGQNIEKELISDSALSYLERIAAHLPQALSFIELECRLTENDPLVDLILRISSSHEERDFLSGDRKDPLLSEAFATSKEWRLLRKLAKRWRDPFHFLDQWIPAIYLEFDGDHAFETVPIPSVFTTLDSPQVRLPVENPYLKMPEFASTCEMAQILLGDQFTDSLKTQTLHCFESLCESSRMFYSGVMLGRGQKGLRLSAFLPQSQIIPYLERLGWDFSFKEVKNILEKVAEFLPPDVQIDFDINDKILPRFALHLVIEDIEPRKAFLRRLVDLGICSPTKAALLGHDTPHRKHVSFKLTCIAGTPQIITKAYFAVI